VSEYVKWEIAFAFAALTASSLSLFLHGTESINNKKFIHKVTQFVCINVVPHIR
jgi:hypothetical protein